MDPERWRQVQTLLADAMERPEAERARFLRERCGGDAELRAEVESLIRASPAGDAFFDRLGRRVGVSEVAAGPASTGDGAVSVRASLEEAIGERYRIESLLDRGGMGLVFLAIDRKHGRRVAIKTIHPELDATLRARFEREIRITAGLQHPHILPLLDSGTAGRTLFYIMPYVEGESLKTRLDRLGTLPPTQAVQIALDVAAGLEHAHGRGVLHRDVKPSNILLAEGHVQIVDFGIARAVVEIGEADLTATGFGLGTPNYMAPEQLVGRSTARSDVYALGAVLYEALTGRVWRTETTEGRASWKAVPEQLRPLIARALAEAPGDRWSNIAEFAHALRDWLDAEVGARSRHSRAGLLARLRRHLVSARQPPQADRKSIAVLPFENLNRDQETEYFSDGITDDIIAHLSGIGELKVISRTSVMRYKGARESIPEIGRDLGVATVLEGSVRRVGDRVRIVSQLVDTGSDEHLWSRTFDRELTDIFDIQSEVAQQIAQALQARMTEAERSMIRRRPTEDVEAHDLYLKGRHLWARRTQAGLESAEDQFQRAIARDPLFAPAYAGLADVHLLLAGYRYRDEIESLGRARVAVERALELDDRLAEAHASRGQILRADRDWAGEEREYRRAIELNPNYATAHQWYATLLSALGRSHEAEAEICAATELDPLSHAIRVTCGGVRFMARDYDGALDDFRRTTELAPRFFSAYAWLSLLWSAMGEFERAMEAWRRLRDLHPDPYLASVNRAFILAWAGEREGALDILREARPGSGPRGLSGIIYGLLGDTDKAFRLLEEALDDASWRLFVLERSLLFYIKVGPWFDSLRDDPRFEGLLRRMNFTG